MKNSVRITKVVCLLLLAALVSSSTTHAVTSALGFYWDKTSVYCYVKPEIRTRYGTAVYNAIISGITTWNSTEAPNTVISDDYINWDVLVDMNQYGETGWDAITYHYVDPDTNISESQQICINSSGPKANYLSDTGLWKAIACHEMGHAHGAGHNTTNSEFSILKPYTEDYYDYVDGYPHITVPQPPDITCINGIY